MTDYCLFTVEHSKARRVYVRGIADITEPIDEYRKIIKFYHGFELKSGLPPNPFEEETVEHELYDELISSIKSEFEGFGDELVFASISNEICKYSNPIYVLEKQKVII